MTTCKKRKGKRKGVRKKNNITNMSVSNNDDYEMKTLIIWNKQSYFKTNKNEFVHILNKII